MRDRLIEQFRAAHSDVSVRCVVLTAAGDRHFCTGSDLRIRPPMAPKPEGAPDMVVGSASYLMRSGFQALMESIQDCQKPVILALNGTAAGGGAMLTLAADLVIAADTARIVDVFGKQALIPDGGFLYLLPRIVGMHKAAQIVFLGETLSADELAELGIVEPGRAGRRARGRHRRVGAAPRGQAHEGARLGEEADARRDREPARRDARGRGHLHRAQPRHEDGKERMAAMMEKRDPVWRGF